VSAPPAGDPVLVLPGRGDSDAGHWQSLWQATHTNFHRVAQDSWDRPVRSAWQGRLEEAVAHHGARSVFAAHSLGCLLAVHWAATTPLRAHGALLVGVPNPDRPAFPREISGFSPLPMQPLPFPSIIVASSDDPYGSLQFAQRCAAAWGSGLVTLGAAGHINTASGYGAWPEGLQLLAQLTAR
jgi:uncharacterized protein